MNEEHVQPFSSIPISVDADLAELIPGFIENRKKDLHTIQTCIQQNDWETIELLGHSMKGLGSSYGFDEVTNKGALIEEAAKIHRSESILAAVHELNDYFKRVVIEFL